MQQLKSGNNGKRRISIILTWAVILWAALCAPSARAGTLSDIPTTSTWVTNGPVLALAATSSTIYLGGEFDFVGPYTGGLVPLSAAIATPLGNFPQVNGKVNACVADGAGGWYIGGSFTQVGDLARARIAHLLADGRVDPAWAPNADGEVLALAVAGGKVYAGGRFRFIGGQTRFSIAALDPVSGAATPWHPDANGDVYTLAVSGSTIYAGGAFYSIGGQMRSLLAALDASSGAATAWNANVSGHNVFVLAVSGQTLYLGGYFDTVGGQPRNNLAAVNTTNGGVTTWNPYAGGLIYALAVSGGSVYVGGAFNTMGSAGRNNLAALDVANAAVTAWNPNAIHVNAVSSGVRSLAVMGGTVYAGGDFTSIGGQARCHLAAMDAVSGAATNWNPNASSDVLALAVAGGTVYAGGSFNSVGGVARNNAAALDVASGAATAWNPNAGAAVSSLAVSGGTVYAGGSFYNIGGQARSQLAALNATTGVATAWNPSPNGWVAVVKVSGGTVYVGGGFSNIGGQARSCLAALDASTGAVKAWDPGPNGTVRALAVSGGAVYAGGDFYTIGGKTSPCLAAIDATSGAVTAWNTNISGSIYTLATWGGMVYAGGCFSTGGVQPRRYLVALDASSGAMTAWNPGIDYDIMGLAVSGGTVYAGGYFPNAGGQVRHRLAAIDAVSGVATAWDPDASGPVNALATLGGAVYAGGQFLTIDGQDRPFFAQFGTPALPPAPLAPHATPLDPTSIRWEWDDASNTEDGFKVWADPGTAAPTTLRVTTAAGATSWTMTSLAANTQYTFQVAATNALGDSARTAPYTTWTLIQPVGALTFPTVTATSIAVAPSGTFSNLTAGLSGIYLANDTAVTANNWQQTASPWVSSPLTPNALYAFRGRSRNGARISGASASATQWTLAPPPAVGANVTCDQTTGAVHLLGTTFTFNNPAGFGASAHGGNAYKVSAYHWVWDTTPVHVPSASDDQWNASSMAFTPDVSGIYYLHLAALNAVGVAQPAILHYGPFLALAPGRLTASPASLSFLEGSPWAVDVEKGGAPTQKTLTLTNPGAIAVTFSGGNVATPGLRLIGPAAVDYQIAAVSPSTATPLAPGGSLTVTIRFAPTESRRTMGLAATLEVTCDSPVTPFMTIPLTGDAVPVGLSSFSVE